MSIADANHGHEFVVDYDPIKGDPALRFSSRSQSRHSLTRLIRQRGQHAPDLA